MGQKNRFVWQLEGKWPATRWASRSVCVVAGLLHLVITTFLLVQICYSVFNKKTHQTYFQIHLTQRIVVFFPHTVEVVHRIFLKPGLLVPLRRPPRFLSHGGSPSEHWMVYFHGKIREKLMIFGCTHFRTPPYGSIWSLATTEFHVLSSFLSTQNYAVLGFPTVYHRVPWKKDTMPCVERTVIPINRGKYSIATYSNAQ
jgi:hypothetical protein